MIEASQRNNTLDVLLQNNLPLGVWQRRKWEVWFCRMKRISIFALCVCVLDIVCIWVAMQSLCTFTEPSYTSPQSNLTHTADELNCRCCCPHFLHGDFSQTAEVIFTITPTYLPHFDRHETAFLSSAFDT